jgi:site-specific DNA-methyltransferase (adenine-specific)
MSKQKTDKNPESKTEQLQRLDISTSLRKKIIPLCRIKQGEIWEDSEFGHRVGVLDATDREQVLAMFGRERVQLVVNDPPYNVTVGARKTASLFKSNLAEYLTFSRSWLENCRTLMDKNAHLYIWMGADARDSFQPLPDFIFLMREFPELKTRNWITLRNQRGYGTQKNWMWVRQELLHYIKGAPPFQVTYTEIPKILKGYYKTVEGKRTENLERSKSSMIRPGNVWIDIQQVFYRTEENVPGCYAQKPLKAIQRIIQTSSEEGDLIADFFSHSGTTLLAGEMLKRRVYTFDFDPVFAEISIRRLENFRQTKRTGWQWRNPFPELENARLETQI